MVAYLFLFFKTVGLRALAAFSFSSSSFVFFGFIFSTVFSSFSFLVSISVIGDRSPSPALNQ